MAEQRLTTTAISGAMPARSPRLRWCDSSELLDKSAQTCGTRLPISMLEDSPPVYLADLAWGMYTNTSKAPQQDKCFHRVVFIETSRYRPAVCYMSRRLRKDRVRYWTKELEGKVEGDLRAWAAIAIRMFWTMMCKSLRTRCRCIRRSSERGVVTFSSGPTGQALHMNFGCGPDHT